MNDAAKRIGQFFGMLIFAIFFGVGAFASMSISGNETRGGENPVFKGESSLPGSDDLETATFGNGCFWCTEALFAQLKGVDKVTSGYSGGHTKDPTYKEVCNGETGHAEVVQVVYDPNVITFKELLEVFWSTHDPTTKNRQGADVGTQYRSAIFYHDDKQKELAEKYKAKLDKEKVFDRPIVTEITKFDKFYPAENYHQDYYELNGSAPYCNAVIRPKMEKLRKVFKDKLKDKKIDKSNAQWKQELTDMQYFVTREQGTEEPFENEYWDNKLDGTYECVCCGKSLFDSKTKYESGTGWPSFWKPIAESAVQCELDLALWEDRTAVKCARCDAHLGHVFPDGPKPTGLRFCLNSAALKFVERSSASNSNADRSKAGVQGRRK
jgi:peptide methionine sulfoxide reductase msrA/msrB